MTTETGGGMVMRLISRLPADSRRRVMVTAQILRDLLAADDEHRESELAFTLVMAEISEQPSESEPAHSVTDSIDVPPPCDTSETSAKP